MITKEARESAYRRLLAEGRQQLGLAPTFDEVEALSRNELPEAEAESVRARLAHYPELWRVMTAPFPETVSQVLTEEQLAEDLASIRNQVRKTPASAQPVPLHRRQASAWRIAAGVVLAVAIGGVAIRQWTLEPRPVATLVLYSDGTRGGPTPATAPSTGAARISISSDYLLKPAFSGRRHYPRYRLDLIDLGTDPPRRIYSENDIQRQPDDTYPITLETDDLKLGLYRLVLYGVDDTDDLLAEYTLRVVSP